MKQILTCASSTTSTSASFAATATTEHSRRQAGSLVSGTKNGKRRRARLCSLEKAGEIMLIHWHSIPFNHSCGLEGTVLEIRATCDGDIILDGVCVMCGTQFSTKSTFIEIMRACTILDYEKGLTQTPEEMLLECPKGGDN